MINQEYSERPLRQFNTLLRRRWKMIAAFMLVGLAVAVLIGLIVPPRYTASAQLLVGESRISSAASRDEDDVETHVALLMSPSHLWRVYESLASGPQANLDTVDGSGLEPQEMVSPDDLWKNVNVYKERLSRVVTVTFTWTDPQIAAVIANRVADLYVQKELDQVQAELRKAQMDLEDRIPAARAELGIAEAAVREHRRNSGFIDVRRLDAMDREIAELNRQLEINISDVTEYDAHLAVLKRYRQQDDGLSLFFETLEDPWFAESYRPSTFAAPGMTKSVGDSEQASGGAVTALGQAEDHDQASKMADSILAQLELDRSVIEARGGEIRRRLQSLERSREATRNPERRLRELEREAEAAAQLYESLVQRKIQFAAQGAVRAGARLVSPALIPAVPSSPSPILFLLPAVVAAGIAGGVVSILIEQLDRRLRSERDINEGLGIPCIGLLPKMDGTPDLAQQRKLIDNPFDPYSEAVRSAVTAALTPLSHEPVVFCVTSSQRQEGKTTLAISFAVGAALQGRRVLLIDLDLRAPSISRVLNGSDEFGVADLLNGRNAHDVIKNSADLGIDYLPFSAERSDPLMTLSMDRLPDLVEGLKDLVEGLKEQYDCIVIDSLPVLSAAEARLFASLADRVIFAVRWGVTDQDVARHALHQFKLPGTDNLADVVSAVVTQVDMRMHIYCRYDAPANSGMLPRDVPPPRFPLRRRPSRQSSAA